MLDASDLWMKNLQSVFLQNRFAFYPAAACLPKPPKSPESLGAVDWAVARASCEGWHVHILPSGKSYTPSIFPLSIFKALLEAAKQHGNLDREFYQLKLNSIAQELLFDEEYKKPGYKGREKVTLIAKTGIKLNSSLNNFEMLISHVLALREDSQIGPTTSARISAPPRLAEWFNKIADKFAN